MLVPLRILHNPSQFVCGTETGQKYDAVNIHDNKGRKPVWLSAEQNFPVFPNISNYAMFIDVD